MFIFIIINKIKGEEKCICFKIYIYIYLLCYTKYNLQYLRDINIYSKYT